MIAPSLISLEFWLGSGIGPGPSPAASMISARGRYAGGMVAVTERLRRTRLVLWALVVGLVIGVIGMHHLAAQHGTPAPEPGGHGVAAMGYDAESAANLSTLGQAHGSYSGIDRAASPGHGGSATDLSPTSAEPSPASPPTVSTDSVDPHGPMSGAMQHLCMAILGGLLLLVLGPAGLRGLRAGSDSARSDSGAAVRPRDAPPAPVPLRLAQLQVLRL